MAKKVAKGTKAKATVKRAVKAEPKKYPPTAVALGCDAKGKPQLIVGERRIGAFKGEIVERTTRYWSQLKYLKVGRTAGGQLRLTSARAAAAAGLELVE